MADIRAFRGLRYNPAVFGTNLTEVTCPPYDVITPPEQAGLVEQHPQNIIRLELPQDQPSRSRYAAAAEQLQTWLQERVLVQENVPTLYAYRTSFDIEGQARSRHGIVAALHVEPWEQQVVRPHERTFAGPKQDRLELMRACGANFSPIWGLYQENEGATERVWATVADREPDWWSDDREGVRHEVWAVTDPEVIGAWSAALSTRPVYIADGHHRYETAMHFQQERNQEGTAPADAAWNFVMTYLVEATDPGLIVRGTHRLVRAHPAMTAETLRSTLAQAFDLIDFEGTPTELLARLEEIRDRPAFGIWAPSLGLNLVASAQDPAGVPVELAGSHSAAWRGLDLAVLHVLAIDRLYAEGTTKLSEDGYLSYPRSLAEVESAINDGDAQIVFLLRTTPVAQIMAVADAGDLMPEKSTFFVPKPITGMVIARLEGEVATTR
jgi:uncharacterized protein (DUF1015 family)